MTDQTPLGKPPCGSCTLCCRGWQAVAMMPEDDPTQYELVLAGEVLLLAFKPNGDCYYLGEHGCTIHDRAPVVCREFDCRGSFLLSTRPERRQMVRNRGFSAELYARGRELVPTLDPDGLECVARAKQAKGGRYVLDHSNNLGKRMHADKNGVVANIVLSKEKPNEP